MSIRAFLNGQPWASSAESTEGRASGGEVGEDGATWVDRLAAELERQGWELHRLTLDGETATLSQIASLEGGDHVVTAEAGPARFDVNDVARQLAAAIPNFRIQLTEVGEQFSRGDWRSGLSRLPGLLEELRVALAGLQMVFAALGAEPPGELSRLPEVLQGLSQQIELQSWVEVSDCILYEVVPLLESWDSSHQGQG